MKTPKKTQKRVFCFYFLIFLAISSHAQIKIHDDNHVSLGSLTKSYGTQVKPDGLTYFQSSSPLEYGWMNLTYANNFRSKCYIVQYGQDHTFFVLGNGMVWSSNHYISSSINDLENISEIDSSLSKVLQLRGILYDLKELEQLDTTTITDKYGYEISFPNAPMGIDGSNKFVDSTILKTLTTEKERKSIGMVAEEVEKVIPELVRTKPDGTKSIAYFSLASLLVEALKEQQKEINELKQKLESSQLKSAGTTDNSGLQPSKVKDASGFNKQIGGLLQNVPNPFSDKTIIRYKIDNLAGKVAIFVFDLQGTLVKSFENLIQPEGQITINGFELKPGMYLYTLVIDGSEVDSKRMIITN